MTLNQTSNCKSRLRATSREHPGKVFAHALLGDFIVRTVCTRGDSWGRERGKRSSLNWSTRRNYIFDKLFVSFVPWSIIQLTNTSQLAEIPV